MSFPQAAQKREPRRFLQPQAHTQVPGPMTRAAGAEGRFASVGIPFRCTPASIRSRSSTRSFNCPMIASRLTQRGTPPGRGAPRVGKTSRHWLRSKPQRGQTQPFSSFPQIRQRMRMILFPRLFYTIIINSDKIIKPRILMGFRRRGPVSLRSAGTCRTAPHCSSPPPGPFRPSGAPPNGNHLRRFPGSRSSPSDSADQNG